MKFIVNQKKRVLYASHGTLQNGDVVTIEKIDKKFKSNNNIKYVATHDKKGHVLITKKDLKDFTVLRDYKRPRKITVFLLLSQLLVRIMMLVSQIEEAKGDKKNV
ncbi:hypothetical protein [Macrococcus sp. DPC7161]|uniref:hypothetical protein n=1 Tax=Macrococcus sp. DPC7161 TaxID=2507060 RepID=UPI00100C1336|nr:hypothetical protein [Macrococcus sp. DPC7161]RXK19067.1 hypothetical protein ER639_01770 [Macrococcus sp. DPC7161]